VANKHPGILDGMLRELREKGRWGNRTDIKEAIRTSFHKANAEMSPENIKDSGTTAIVCLCLTDHMYIANVGDTRAVAWKHGKAKRLSVDHKPHMHEEEKRIRNLGGFVINGRVCGQLAVSRAFGDCTLQTCGVTPDPYVKVIDMNDPPEFIILACDGVWDKISDQWAGEIVASEIENNNDIVRACVKLRDFAYLYGSTDNISVVLIQFPKK